MAEQNNKKRKNNADDGFKIPNAADIPKPKQSAAAKQKKTETEKKQADDVKNHVQQQVSKIIAERKAKGYTDCTVDTENLLTARLAQTEPGKKFITTEVKWFRQGLQDYTVRANTFPSRTHIVYVINWDKKP